MEMTQLLKKYELNFDLSWTYTLDQLKEVNALSVEVLKLVDFKKGHFFTLLPDDADFEMLHNFKIGLILPQYPEQEQIVDGKKSTFSWIPSIKEELSELIFNEMKSKLQFTCIFDQGCFMKIILTFVLKNELCWKIQNFFQKIGGHSCSEPFILNT